MISFGSRKTVKFPTVDECDIIEYGPTEFTSDLFNDDVVRVKPTELGHTFWIIQYKLVRKGIYNRKVWEDHACFSAVLLDPAQYVQSIANNGYSGIIVKLHPTCEEDMKAVYEQGVELYGEKDV